MKKENINKTSKWISELGELVPIKYNKKVHRTKLNKSNKDMDDYVRKPYDESYFEIGISKETNQIQIKEIKDEDNLLNS